MAVNENASDRCKLVAFVVVIIFTIFPSPVVVVVVGVLFVPVQLVCLWLYWCVGCCAGCAGCGCGLLWVLVLWSPECGLWKLWHCVVVVWHCGTWSVSARCHRDPSADSRYGESLADDVEVKSEGNDDQHDH